jgi:CheY-like chemotaxis protein
MIRPLKTILIVDDNEVIRMVLETLLLRAGFVVVAATNGLEAVEAVKSQEFSAIIMDVKMPIMDGLTATKEIRDLGHRMPIIGYSADALRSECLDHGMNELMQKPVSNKRIVSILEVFCDPLAA